ncbi:MAG: heme exporter protein CcmD [Stellaceae bacterium]
MANIAHYLAMGGFAVYVWPAFGIATLIMGALAITSVSTYRRRQRELERLEREDLP